MEVLRKIHPYSLFMFGVVLVIQDKFIPPFILLLFITSIPFFSKPKLKEIPVPFIALISLFVLYLIGLTYTKNMSFGLKDIETKLSFILFPLLYIFTFNKIEAKSLNFAKAGFIVGTVLSILLSFIIATQCKSNGGEDCFSASQFGFQMHATYLSTIFIIASVWVIESKTKVLKLKLIKISYVLLVLIACYFLRSLSSFLVIFAVAMVYYFHFIFKERKYKWLLLIPVLLGLILISVNSLPQLKKDLGVTYDKMSFFLSDNDQFLKENAQVTESNTVRLVAYSTSFNMIKELPFGEGTGDIKDMLHREFNRTGFSNYSENGYNPHSTFLQTGIAIGWIGILLLLVIFFQPIINKAYRLDRELLLFIIIIFISCLFESFLERQVGVILLSSGLVISFYNFHLKKSQLK